MLSQLCAVSNLPLKKVNNGTKTQIFDRNTKAVNDKFVLRKTLGRKATGLLCKVRGMFYHFLLESSQGFVACS